MMRNPLLMFQLNTIRKGTIKPYKGKVAMLGGSLVTTGWRALRLRMDGRPPYAEGSCKYIE
jgi:hypothetical protein